MNDPEEFVVPFTAEDTASRVAAIEERQRTQDEYVREMTELNELLRREFPGVGLQKARVWWALVKRLNEKLREQYCGGKDDLRVSSTEDAWTYMEDSPGHFGLAQRQVPSCAEILTRMAQAQNDYGQIVTMGNHIHGKVTISMTAPLPSG